jgi:hypothetical protein
MMAEWLNHVTRLFTFNPYVLIIKTNVNRSALKTVMSVRVKTWMPREESSASKYKSGILKQMYFNE